MKDNQLKKILFVCLGNICRSPAAETIFNDLASKKGLHILVDSAGISNWHQGEKADQRMRKTASARGYNLTSISRPFTKKDFDNFDMIIAMDDQNYADLQSYAQTTEEEDKLYRMRDFLTKHKIDHIPDPYYEGIEGFNYVIDLLEDASEGLIKKLRE